MQRVLLLVKALAFTIAVMLCANNLFAQSTQTFNSSGTFVVPAGVTSIKVECWGAGGGGGNASSQSQSGGGGGAYASSVISVTPGASYTITVGTGGTPGSAGGVSSFETSVIALGGGAGNNMTAGLGGSALASTGTTKYNGGNGGQRNNGIGAGGGGGGSAFATTDGNIGAAGNAGGAGGTGTGNGGNGGSTGNSGTSGNVPGGGGGGKGDGVLTTSGSGASGRVVISWCPSATIVYENSPYCSNGGTASVSLVGASGGEFTSTPGLSINASTGAVNLAASTAGTYTVTYTLDATTDCAEFQTTASITITQLPAATISYSGTPYCSNGGTATVTLVGSGGGTFSSAAGLSIDGSTGAVNLGASTPGSYTVTYTIAAANGCPQVQATAPITITQLPSATISYNGSPYCSNGGSATVTQTGTSGGTYSSTAGLSIDANTGEVDLDASTAGSYTVTYTIAAANGCPQVQATTSITITQLPAATISYSGTPYCSNGGTATVTLVGTAGGTFSSTAGLSIDGSTGAVNLGASTPGSYTVTYTIAAAAGCPQVQTTTGITITQLPAATISYDGTPYCANEGTANVTQTGTTGGSYSSTSGLSINSGTGAIDLAASTPGTYTVTYTIAASDGCPQVQATTSITIYAVPNNASGGFTGSIICVGGTGTLTFDAINASFVTPYTISYTDGTNTWNQLIASASATTFNVAVNPTTTTTYTLVSITNGNGCVRTTGFGDATAQIMVNALPVCSITGTSGPVCPSSSTEFSGPAGMSVYAWSLQDANGATIPGATNQQTVTVVAGAGCNTSFKLILTITNANNCSSTCDKTVTVVDNIAPTFTAPNNITVYTDANCAANTTPAVTGDVSNESDNCSTGLNATYSDNVVTGPCQGRKVITRTWSLSDNCGNPAENQVQTITVLDNTAPSFTAPGDITVYTDADCNSNTTPANTGDVTDEDDNCSTGLNATYSDNVSTGPCQGRKVITRTWSLVDYCGNAAANQVQTITVLDNTAPTFTAPNNITVYTDANCSANTTPANTGDVTNEDDNCSTGLNATYSDNVVTGPCQGRKVITRTWSLVDDCGNAAANQQQTITVLDNTAPTFTAPNNITVYTDANCASNTTPAVTGDVTDEDDNCSTGLNATYSDNVSTGPCQGRKVITRTWSLVDDCGNAAANQVQTITVLDNAAPTFTAPDNITVYTDANCNANTTPANTGDVTNEDDNCSTGLNATYSDNVVTGPCQGRKVITRTWSLVDDCGNAAANQQQTITVLDNTAPTFTAPNNITVYTDADCNAGTTPTSTGDVTNEADNCSTGLNATFSDNVTTGPCQGRKVITRTWSLVDNCGNAAANQVQTITVLDNTAPTFTAPDNITVYTDADCNANTTIANTGDVTNEDDNCSTGLNATYSDNVVTGPCQGRKVITRTWSLVDDCGNAAANQIQTITVLDNTAPTFTAPDNITVYTDASCNSTTTPAATGDVTNEADNCSTGLNATYSDNVVTGPCQGRKVITRTWSLVDNCGNAAANQVQTITVLDNIPPTFTAPDDITVYTNASCSANTTPASTGDVANEADNCSTGLNATFSDNVTTGPCQGRKVITRTWSLVDNCGNAAANQVQTITVLDNTAPTFTAPNNITVYTDANCNSNTTPAATGDVTNEADNCSTGLNATYSDNTVTGPCTGRKVITRTWSLVDNCGNAAANQVQTITVLDNTAPTFTAPDNITVYTDASCNANTTPATTGDVSNEADNCSTGLNATYSDNVVTGPCQGRKVITRTWSLVDNCNNAAANQVQTITVLDNTAPTFTAPDNITVYTDANCNANTTPASTGDVTNEADNCSTGLNATFSDNVVTGPCQGRKVITRTWSLVDNCGNAAANQLQTITVLDNTAPTFTAPANITVYVNSSCSANTTPAATGDVTNEADNCSTGLNATYSDNVVTGPCTGRKVITRTWSLVDNCSNAAANQVQTITVLDTISPVITVLNSASTPIANGATVNVTYNPAVCGFVYTYSVSASDNCSPTVTPVRTVGPASGSTFVLGETLVRHTATDECNNMSTHSFVVKVNPLDVAETLIVSPSTQQYSDQVTFTARITGGAAGTCGGPPAATSVTFYVGTQNMGTVPMASDGSGNLVGSLTEELLEGVAGQMSPGVKTVTAVFGGVNNYYFVVSNPAPQSLTIIQEDAVITYTGQLLQATPCSTCDSTEVELRANIADISLPSPGTDGYPGDIRNAYVKFRVVEDSYESGWIKVDDLVFAGDTRLGTVSIPGYKVKMSGTATSAIKTVQVLVGYDDTPGPTTYMGYYIAQMEQVVLTVYKPNGDFITGGGYILPTQSAGVYATNQPGLKANFGFNVKFNKKGTNLQGNMNFIIRRMEGGELKTYQIKSNSMTSLGVDASDPDEQTAVFVSKANLADISGLVPISLGGNLRLEVRMTDRGEPGTEDEISIQLTNGSNALLYSSHWVISNTEQIFLAAGNLVVHSSFNLGSSTPVTQGINEFSENIPPVTGLQVKVFGNPTTNQFTMIPESGKEGDISVRVFDINGQLLFTRQNLRSGQLVRFGNEFKIGAYIAEVVQGDERQTIKLIKQ